MSGGLNQASGGLKSFGDNLVKVGASLTALTAPLMAAGAAGVQMAMDLDTQMRNIQSVSKQTNEEIAALSDTFVEMSTDMTKTTDSAINLASAFYDIQGSGFAGEEAMMVLEAATKAATAGLTETAVAAQGITAVINSYGMAAQDAAHVSDLMFETVNRGVGTFEELTSSMSNVVGTANAAGVSFEEVSAAMATMSKQGMTFSEASVSMNQAILAFLKPSTEMATVISELGYESGQAMIEALGFAGAMEAVSEHVGGSADQMAGLFGNVRALRAALALTGDGATMFAEDLAAMAQATGATQEAFAIQMQSFQAQFKNFQNNMNALLIEIGQILLPIINDILQNFILPMIQAFRNLPEPVQKAIVIIGMLVTVLGPLLMIIGGVISAIGTIGTALAAVGGIAGIASAAMTAVGVAIAAITSPIGLAIAAIAALAVAFDKISGGKVSAIPKVWGENFRMLGEIVGLVIEKARNWGENLIKGFLQGMKDMAVKALKWFLDFNIKLADIVKRALKIQSPSKVMMKLGEMTVAGFQEGMASMGGIGVQVPQLSGAGASSSLPSVGVSGAGGGVSINQLIVPPGTTQEQIRVIMQEISRQTKRQGGRATK